MVILLEMMSEKCDFLKRNALLINSVWLSDKNFTYVISYIVNLC